MKKKSTINYLIALLFILTTLTGYGQKNHLRNPFENSLSFPVMTWYGLTADQLDIKHFRDLKNAGFTINFSSLGSYELNKKALDLAQQVGLKLIISDNRIQPGNPVDSIAAEKLNQMVLDYKNFPALLGYFITDEPNTAVFENMAAIKKQISLRDSSHIIYANLFPDYANNEQLGAKTYREYVDKYINMFQPKILSFDYYPFLNTGFRDTYFQNLELIRESALKAGIPFWSFTMSCQIYPPYPKPEESWIRLQLYSDLAYGSKGLQYFTYALPHSGAEDFKIAILDTNGRQTYLYGITKRINSEIHSLEKTIKQLNSIGVYNTEPLPKGTKPMPENFYIKNITGGPMVAGAFNDKSGSAYLLLVNRNYEKAVDFTLYVSGKVKGFMEVPKSAKKNNHVFKVKKGIIKLQFKAGDGRLFQVL